MARSAHKLIFRVALGAVAALAPLEAQSPLLDSPRSLTHAKESVQFLYPEQIEVAAGDASSVELHFRVAEGLHINSHSPQDKFLIATNFVIPPDSGVRLEDAQYPPGKDFTLPADRSTHLSVYSGEFAIRARIVAKRGNHLVQASLHYQACDESICLPPKTIVVPIDVVAR